MVLIFIQEALVFDLDVGGGEDAVFAGEDAPDGDDLAADDGGEGWVVGVLEGFVDEV